MDDAKESIYNWRIDYNQAHGDQAHELKREGRKRDRSKRLAHPHKPNHPIGFLALYWVHAKAYKQSSVLVTHTDRPR